MTWRAGKKKHALWREFDWMSVARLLTIVCRSSRPEIYGTDISREENRGAGVPDHVLPEHHSTMRVEYPLPAQWGNLDRFQKRLPGPRDRRIYRAGDSEHPRHETDQLGVRRTVEQDAGGDIVGDGWQLPFRGAFDRAASDIYGPMAPCVRSRKSCWKVSSGSPTDPSSRLSTPPNG